MYRKQMAWGLVLAFVALVWGAYGGLAHGIVQVGAGEKTVTVNAFLPQQIRIPVGETVIFKINSDEIHTVTFLSGANPPEPLIPVPGGQPGELMLNPQFAFPTRLPGAPIEIYNGTGFVSSGVMAKQSEDPNVPPNDTFSLKFVKPGTYVYVCLLHPTMRGVIVVEEPGGRGLSQAQIGALAQQELRPLMAQVEVIRELYGNTANSEPGPNGTTIWYVRAGGNLGDPTVEVMEFLIRDLTIKEGDTVVWVAPSPHTITFHPGIPRSELTDFIPKPQEQGPPLLLANPRVWFPSKPSGEFDGTGYFNSGVIGLGPSPNAFAMTFTKPGKYKYMCALHRGLGMEGTIMVEPRV
ncbi:MAG: plastocyanin/azurin family copper-binding protein [Candidatus Bipolaricaulia bacterium]